MESDSRTLTIGAAGNTQNPCLLALRTKGYVVRFEFTKHADGYRSEVIAQKAGRHFSASNAAELLGLVAMWEVRGDDWQTKPGEADVYNECHPNSRTYDNEGNLIEVGGEPVA